MSVHLRKRKRKDGSMSYSVVYRQGGRGYRQHHAGSFRTLKEARARRDLVGGWLANGMDPKLELAKLKHAPTRKTVADWYDAFIASRIDVAPNTTLLYGSSRNRITPILGFRLPELLEPADVQQAVNSLNDLAPGTVKDYVSTLAQVLDYAGVDPNPARSKRVRLPRKQREEVTTPTSVEWFLIRDHMARRCLLPVRLLECLGLRISEGMGLTYGDVDFTHGRVRVSRARTKGGTAGQRWLPVPDELLDGIAELCPFEDRQPERRVFAHLTTSGLRNAMYTACRDAGLASHHPHELRHRRISLWMAHGIDVIQVKTWAGHAKASMTQDVYSHLIAEPHLDEWRDFWIGAYRAARGERFDATPEPVSAPPVKESEDA